MAAMALRRHTRQIPKEANRALFIRNLPYSVTSEPLYDLFGRYGAIRQIRLGSGKSTKGTAYVVYEDIYDAMNAVKHLSGFNVDNRYLLILYHQPTKMHKKIDLKKKEEELAKLQEKYGVSVKD